MPANSFLGNRDIVRVVDALASFVYDRASTYAEVLAVPSPGGTALVLPDDPADGDSYQWANPDNSAGATAAITLALSAKALAAGVTIQGASSQAFTTAGTSGRAVYFERANAWQLFPSGSSTPPSPGGVTGTYSFVAGIVVGSAVYVSANDTVSLAVASSAATLPAVGIVSRIAGAVATVVYAGEVASSGLTAGARMYVSPTVPGALTATAPTSAGQVVQQVGVAKDAATLIVSPQQLTQL